MNEMANTSPALDAAAVPSGYEPPAITTLGHLADLTLLGSGGLNELEDDGSIA
jgi:hypothetical protein